MDYRKHTIFTGKTFRVPKHIVRLDSDKTHGWQLRYGPWKLFSDFSNDGSGAKASLQLATEELTRRIARLPAPTGLRTQVRAGKASDLPLGISGPIARHRAGRNVPYYSLQVSLPLVGGRSANKSVYIATENTLTQEKYDLAVEKAVALRDSHVRKFKLAATKSKRASFPAALR